MNETEVRSVINKLQFDNPLVVNQEYQQAFIESFVKLDFPYTKNNAKKLLKSLGKM